MRVRVTVADGGMVYVFEKAEGDKDYYKRERSFKIEANAVKIKNLAVTPSEEQLVRASRERPGSALAWAAGWGGAGQGGRQGGRAGAADVRRRG